MSENNATVTCLFVHGWGMNHTIWQPVLEKLPGWIDAQAIDLPGHGQRFNESFSNLQDLSNDLCGCFEGAKKTHQPLVVVAWSLGALPCLQLLSEQFDTVDALMIVSSNPCFVSRESWDCGIGSDVFDQFAKSLKADFSGTIRRFLSLQVKGSESGRAILRNLREKILQQPQPDARCLDAGLDILKQADLRDQLTGINQPVSWALGAQDGLVNIELAGALENIMDGAQVKVYEKAGHAPFLSHTDEFVLQLEKFISGSIEVRHSGRL